MASPVLTLHLAWRSPFVTQICQLGSAQGLPRLVPWLNAHSTQSGAPEALPWTFLATFPLPDIPGLLRTLFCPHTCLLDSRCQESRRVIFLSPVPRDRERDRDSDDLTERKVFCPLGFVSVLSILWLLNGSFKTVILDWHYRIS